MFKLTQQEQRILVFVLVAFLAGLAIKQWKQSTTTHAAITETSAR